MKRSELKLPKNTTQRHGDDGICVQLWHISHSPHFSHLAKPCPAGPAPRRAAPPRPAAPRRAAPHCRAPRRAARGAPRGARRPATAAHHRPPPPPSVRSPARG
eukprot:gene19969-biopygen17547